MVRQTDAGRLGELERHLERVIGEVRCAVEDWQAMRERALEAAGRAARRGRRRRPRSSTGSPTTTSRSSATGPRDGPGLGILRDSEEEDPTAGLTRDSGAITLSKANTRSTVHRAAYLDFVGVGDARFLGLYTHTAYRATPTEIPILRRRVAGVLERAGFPHGSHNEKALLEILDTYPRDELFQISDDELFDVAMGILHLGERQRLRLFARRDPFGRFFSLLVFVPRDRFNTENRRRIEAILRTATGAATIDYTTRVSESVLVRLHFVAYVEPGVEPDFDAARGRDDAGGRHALVGRRPRGGAPRGARRGAAAATSSSATATPSRPPTAPTGWRARRSPTSSHVEELPEADGLGISLYRPLEAGPRMLRAKLFRAGRR